jgi:hypothetical protein
MSLTCARDARAGPGPTCSSRYDKEEDVSNRFEPPRPKIRFDNNPHGQQPRSPFSGDLGLVLIVHHAATSPRALPKMDLNPQLSLSESMSLAGVASRTRRKSTWPGGFLGLPGGSFNSIFTHLPAFSISVLCLFACLITLSAMTRRPVLTVLRWC